MGMELGMAHCRRGEANVVTVDAGVLSGSETTLQGFETALGAHVAPVANEMTRFGNSPAT